MARRFVCAAMFSITVEVSKSTAELEFTSLLIFTAAEIMDFPLSAALFISSIFFRFVSILSFSSFISAIIWVIKPETLSKFFDWASTLVSKVSIVVVIIWSEEPTVITLFAWSIISCFALIMFVPIPFTEFSVLTEFSANFSAVSLSSTVFLSTFFIEFPIFSIVWLK